MIRSLFHRMLLRRHFWRYASFGEVAEVYMSGMLRMVAVYTAASFGSVYLYQNGYSVVFIALFWAIYYFAKALLDLPLAQYVVRYGPKHGTLLSNLLYIPAMICLMLVPTYGIPMLVVAGIFQGLSASLYSVSYNVNFSKVKISLHAGKELALMNILNKIASGLSPLIGGFLALYFGPAVALVVSAAFFAGAALPLLRTAEPWENDRKLVFRGFPWRLTWRSIVASIGVGSDASVVRVAWPLFVALLVVGMSRGNVVYAVLGGLTSLVMVADIAISYAYGRLIDRRRGGMLFTTGLIGTIVTYLMRPFLTTIPGVAVMNIANEATAIGYVMAYTRGMFDVADRTGHRATYIGWVQSAQDLGASLSTLLVAAMVASFSLNTGLRWYFVVSAGFLLLLLVARFPLYKR